MALNSPSGVEGDCPRGRLERVGPALMSQVALDSTRTPQAQLFWGGQGSGQMTDPEDNSAASINVLGIDEYSSGTKRVSW